MDASFDSFIADGLGVFKSLNDVKVSNNNAKAAKANATVQDRLAQLAQNKTLMIGIGAVVVLVLGFFIFRRK